MRSLFVPLLFISIWPLIDSLKCYHQVSTDVHALPSPNVTKFCRKERSMCIKTIVNKKNAGTKAQILTRTCDDGGYQCANAAVSSGQCRTIKDVKTCCCNDADYCNSSPFPSIFTIFSILLLFLLVNQ